MKLIRLITFIIALVLWVLIFPVWGIMVAREIAVSAFASVASVFGNKKATRDINRLDSVGKFWLNGFTDLFNILTDDPSQTSNLDNVNFGRLLSETILAILFYSSFIWFVPFLKIFMQTIIGHYTTSLRYLRKVFSEVVPDDLALVLAFSAYVLVFMLIFRIVFGKRR